MRVIGEIDLFEDERLREEMSWLSLAILAATAVAFLLAWTLSAASAGRAGLSALIGCAACAIALPVHELVHAAAFKLLGPVGSKVSFGFEDAFLYTRFHGAPMGRGRFICVLLAPAAILSAALPACCHLAGWPLAGLLACGLHLSGCVGDLLMAAEIARTPEARYVEDTDTGCRLLADDGTPDGRRPAGRP